MTVHQIESARARHQAELARRFFPLHGPRVVSVWPALWAASWAFWTSMFNAGVRK